MSAAARIEPSTAERSDTSQADICVIGAGSSGVTVAKALRERGLSVSVFERGSNIGGMWRYQNDNGLSSAYDSLHIDTSRDNLGYSDFRIPERFPDFLSHRQFLSYLEDYADAFGVRDVVTFNTTVSSVVRKDDGRWAVGFADGDTKIFRAVIVANGHLWDARLPDFPGDFKGPAIHSHHYRTAAPYDGKSVLVVGLGNSAVDIAVDVARRASRVSISTRRSAWVMPKYLFGRPTDYWSAFLARRLALPTPWIRRIMARLVRLSVGDQSRYGLRKPDHPMWREHATLSQDLLPYLGHGWLSIRPDIARLDGNDVVFSDGARDQFDAIIYATGYNVRFPFLNAEAFDPATELRSLYRRMASLRNPGLFFAGLVQPVGPTIPLVEIQGQWLASVLSGDTGLPTREIQAREVQRHRQYQDRVYLDAARYALEVDYRAYAKQLRSDMRTGTAGV